MTIELARRYDQISAKAYEHPADRAATSALHAVPLLDTVIKRMTDLGQERQVRQMVDLEKELAKGSFKVVKVWTGMVLPPRVTRPSLILVLLLAARPHRHRPCPR